MYWDKPTIEKIILDDEEVSIELMVEGPDYSQYSEVILPLNSKLPYISWKTYDDVEAWDVFMYANPEYSYPPDLEIGLGGKKIKVPGTP